MGLQRHIKKTCQPTLALLIFLTMPAVSSDILVAAETGQNTDEQTKKRAFTSKVYSGVIGILIANAVFGAVFTAIPSIVNWYSSGGEWPMHINWFLFGSIGARIILDEHSVHVERYLLAIFVFTQANGMGYNLAKHSPITEWSVLLLLLSSTCSMLACQAYYPNLYDKIQHLGSTSFESFLLFGITILLPYCFGYYRLAAANGTGLGLFLVINMLTVNAADKYLSKSAIKAIVYVYFSAWVLLSAITMISSSWAK